MLPMDPTPILNGSAKFGAVTWLAVVGFLILATFVFFLLRAMVRQNREAVADRVRAVDKFIAYVEKKSGEDFDRVEKLTELHANTVKAVDRVSDALGKVCLDSEANQAANASAMASISTALEASQKANSMAMSAITSSNEANQKAVLSAIDVMQREHEACLRATSLVCSNFGLAGAVPEGKPGGGRNVRRTKGAQGAGG